MKLGLPYYLLSEGKLHCCLAPTVQPCPPFHQPACPAVCRAPCNLEADVFAASSAEELGELTAQEWRGFWVSGRITLMVGNHSGQ